MEEHTYIGINEPEKSDKNKNTGFSVNFTDVMSDFLDK